MTGGPRRITGGGALVLARGEGGFNAAAVVTVVAPATSTAGPTT